MIQSLRSIKPRPQNLPFFSHVPDVVEIVVSIQQARFPPEEWLLSLQSALMADRVISTYVGTSMLPLIFGWERLCWVKSLSKKVGGTGYTTMKKLIWKSKTINVCSVNSCIHLEAMVYMHNGVCHLPSPTYIHVTIEQLHVTSKLLPWGKISWKSMYYWRYGKSIGRSMRFLQTKHFWNWIFKYVFHHL